MTERRELVHQPLVLEHLTPEEQQIAQELAELEIPVIPENIAAALAQKAVPQHPKEFSEVIQNLSDRTALKANMIEFNIVSIIHSEGTTVWDHVKRSIQEVDSLAVDTSLALRLKILMLYHDFGKTIVADSPINTKATQKRLLNRRSLHAAMLGHERNGFDVMKAGLIANGLDEETVHDFLTIIRHHMNTGLATQNPLKTVEQIDSFAATDAKRQEITQLLAWVLQVDGAATEHIDLEDGELHITNNERKAAVTFEAIWAQYQRGKELQLQQDALAVRQQEDARFQRQVLGSDMQTYLRTRGIAEGPALTTAVRKLRMFIIEHRTTVPDVLKQKIDAVSNSFFSDEAPRKPQVNPYEAKLKVFGERADRIDKNLYHALENRVIMQSQHRFERLSGVAQLRDKPDFGDIDIIALSASPPTEELYKELFGDALLEALLSPNQDSLLIHLPPHGTFHVDFIHASTQEEFETKRSFYAKGYLSRMIGRLARIIGYKYGVDGFFKRYKLKGGADADFLITTRLEDGLQVLGYDAEAFKQIQTLEDIIAFIQTSPYFDASAFDTSDIQNVGQAQDTRSPQSRYLLEALATVERTSTEQDPDLYFKRCFPEKYAEFQAVLEAEQNRQTGLRKPMNGFVIAEQFGMNIKKQGKLVGEILTFVKTNFAGAEEITSEIRAAVQAEFNLTVSVGTEPPMIKEEELRTPEIVIPEVLITERNESIVKFIAQFVEWDVETQRYVKKMNAPNVDRFIVPYRSGPIAIAGLEKLLGQLGIAEFFPPFSKVHGIGYEIYQLFSHSPRYAEVDEDGLFGVDAYSPNAEDDREVFWEWIQEQPDDSPVGKLVAELRQVVQPGERVALFDDTYSLGTITYGVLPGMLIAALGREQARYAIEHNCYIFPKNSGWLRAIVSSTFGSNLEEKERDARLDAIKGGDDMVGGERVVNSEDLQLHEKLQKKMEEELELAASFIEDELKKHKEN